MSHPVRLVLAAFILMSNIVASAAHSAVCSAYAPDGGLGTVTVHSKTVEFEESLGPEGSFSVKAPWNLVSDTCTVSFSTDSELAAITLYDTTDPEKLAHLLVLNVRRRDWTSKIPISLDVQIPPPVVISGFFRDTHQLLVSAAHPFIRDGNATIFPELIEVSPDGEHLIVSSDVRSVSAPSTPIIYLDPANNRLWYGLHDKCSFQSETLFGDIEAGPTITPRPEATRCGAQTAFLPVGESVIFAAQRTDSVSITAIRWTTGFTEQAFVKPVHGLAYWLAEGTIAAPDGRSIAFNVREIRRGVLGSETSAGPVLAIFEVSPLKLVKIVRLSPHASIDSASLAPDLRSVTYYSGTSWETVPLHD